MRIDYDRNKLWMFAAGFFLVGFFYLWRDLTHVVGWGMMAATVGFIFFGMYAKQAIDARAQGCTITTLYGRSHEFMWRGVHSIDLKLHDIYVRGIKVGTQKYLSIGYIEPDGTHDTAMIATGHLKYAGGAEALVMRLEQMRDDAVNGRAGLNSKPVHGHAAADMVRPAGPPRATFGRKLA